MAADENGFAQARLVNRDLGLGLQLRYRQSANCQSWLNGSKLDRAHM